MGDKEKDTNNTGCCERKPVGQALTKTGDEGEQTKENDTGRGEDGEQKENESEGRRQHKGVP